MLEVTYKIHSTYSLKHNEDGHMFSRSYIVPTVASIRGALVASAIKYKSKKWAEERFDQIKDAKIFVQSPKKYSVQQEKRTLLTNKAIGRERKNETLADVAKLTSVGIREFIMTDTIIFYIDSTIEDVVDVLANIHRIGNSESLVSLIEIKRVSSMMDVLIEEKDTDFDYRVSYIEGSDWSDNIKWKNVYAFNKATTYKHMKVKKRLKKVAYLAAPSI